jgi:RND superfamily putative drug exporter
MRIRLSPTSIGRWSARRPWLAIGAWFAFVVLSVAALGLTGSKSLQGGVTGESARAENMLNAHNARPAQYEFAYIHSDLLRVGDPSFRAAAANVAASMERALGSHVTTSVSAGGHSALVSGRIDGPFSTDALRAQVAAAGGAQITAVLDDNGSSGNNDLSRAERLSLPVTLLVLVIAFGALVAAVVPVLLGATAVIATFGLLGPISQVFPLDSSVNVIVLLIGMAVGVDYALFYVIRSREERARGLASHDALAQTARTSGHTVIVAGTTVAIAMAGQFMIGTDIFNGIAAGTIAVIACAVAGSVTVLPAVLELLGPRIDRGRIPFLPHLGSGEDSRFWPAIVDRVLRRPMVSLARGRRAAGRAGDPRARTARVAAELGCDQVARCTRIANGHHRGVSECVAAGDRRVRVAQRRALGRCAGGQSARAACSRRPRHAASVFERRQPRRSRRGSRAAAQRVG